VGRWESQAGGIPIRLPYQVALASLSSHRVWGGNYAMTMPSDREIQGDLSRALQEAQKGDQTAWETLFRECYPKVRRVVRRRLDRSMRSLYDSTDIASDVMKSLAANLNHLSFPSIDSLIAFLAHVAEQKVIDEYRKQHTSRRDKTRERRLSPGDSETAPIQIASLEPTPSQWVQAEEVREWLHGRLDETGRAIIDLKRAGYTIADIADKTGWNIRKVQRLLKNLQDALHESGE
jgi:RNA polymerase sigma factor (sigma-70 family)